MGNFTQSVGDVKTALGLTLRSYAIVSSEYIECFISNEELIARIEN